MKSLFVTFLIWKRKVTKRNHPAPLNPARRRRDRSMRKLARLRQGYGGTQTVRTLFMVHPTDAWRGTKGNTKPKTVFLPPSF
jgi:hypothetical protein